MSNDVRGVGGRVPNPCRGEAVTPRPGRARGVKIAFNPLFFRLQLVICNLDLICPPFRLPAAEEELRSRRPWSGSDRAARGCASSPVTFSAPNPMRSPDVLSGV